MKPLIRICTIVILLAFFACSKKVVNKGETGTPGGDPPTGTSTNCTASISDILHITIFPSDNAWNQDISALPADPSSSQILAPYATAGIKADFGSGLWDNAPIGIPFVVVCGSQQKVPIVFRSNSYDGNYGDESDPGPYPVPLNAPVEGNGQGDSHVLVVDKDNEMLYELYNASVNGDHWEASSGAVFNLTSNQQRPDGWTSADAAGLPIFPGLVKYDEVASGAIHHAIRFTLSSPNVKPAYISPATHKVNSSGGQYSIPFGGKIRLKANFDISSFSAADQVILTALKKYGLILADIGSNMYISGAPDERWNNDDLQQLGKVKASDFEVVKLN
ncbi:MAG TPA: hypothetical protein VII28_02820 [Puia sp.]